MGLTGNSLGLNKRFDRTRKKVRIGAIFVVVVVAFFYLP